MDKKEKNNKKLMRIMIFIIVMLILFIIIALLYTMKEKDIGNKKPNETVNENVEEFVKVLEDQTKLNVSKKLQETKKFKGLEIRNLQITEKNNVTLLTGTITNVSEEKQGGYPVNITIQDKDGNKIITIAAFIGELEPGNTSILSTSATFDYANAYDLIISKRQ